jgi:nitrate/TMAO reductase-like tetraheme cytochrome c subunit
MTDSDEGFFARLWRRPKSRWLLGVPLGGFLMLFAGAIGLGAVNYTLHATSSTEFCFMCHSHELNIRPEYEASSHFRNASGVQAGCADCHLPHDNWFETVARKIVVSADVIGEIRGVISTREKYEAHRGAMARKVWAEFEANDSRFCRDCHNMTAMNFDLQPRKASGTHKRAQEKGQTCIKCHKGIVHALPADGGTLPAT